jgi:hypothetical protein
MSPLRVARPHEHGGEIHLRASRRKAPEMPCLSSCTLHFVAPTLEVAHGWWNTQAVVREHRAHTTFMPVCRQAMHEVQYLGIGVAVVTRP